MESGREQNYWPGFVDALSNVVLTLVFVLVIFVFALAMASNKIEQKLQEVQPVVLTHVTELTQENEVLKQQVADLKKQMTEQQKRQGNACIYADSSRVVTSLAANAQPINGETKISVETNRVVITFPPMVADMDEAAWKSFDTSVRDILKKNPHPTITVKSHTGSEAYSLASRNAYYRAVIIRSRLVEVNQVTANAIDLKTEPSKNGSDGRVEVIFSSE